MLKTNSKKAVDNVIKYICDITINSESEENLFDSYIANGYSKEEAITKTLSYIAKEFFSCKGRLLSNDSARSIFIDWLQGLPSCNIGAHYYAFSANKAVQCILNQTEEEASKYNEMESEKLLSIMIYNRVTSHNSDIKKSFFYWVEFYEYEKD